MKKVTLSILLLIITFNAYCQTGRFATVKLKNPTERTDFSNGFEWIPLMKTNGRINSYMNASNFVVQSQLSGLSFNLQQVTDTGNETTNNIQLRQSGLTSNQYILFDTDGFDYKIEQETIEDKGSAITTLSIKHDDVKTFEFANGINKSFKELRSTDLFSIENSTNGNRIQFSTASLVTAGAGSSLSYNIDFQEKSGTAALLSDIPTIQAGSNVTIDSSDPLNPVISASSQNAPQYQGGTDINVDTTDPLNPVINFTGSLTGDFVTTNTTQSITGNKNMVGVTTLNDVNGFVRMRTSSTNYSREASKGLFAYTTDGNFQFGVHTNLAANANAFLNFKQLTDSRTFDFPNTGGLIVTTVNNVLGLTPTSEPVSASAGDIYYDSSTNKLRCYNGSIWNDLF